MNVRDYIGVLDFTANISANHENTSGVSTDPQVQELVDQTHDLTRRDLLTTAAPSPGAASPAELLPGAAWGPLSGGASLQGGGGASPETEGFSPAPVSATTRRGVAMRNNRVPRLIVVARRGAAKLTGVVTRYKRVRPNNNNNNNSHATLVERFQPSTLHKLRQLGL